MVQELRSHKRQKKKKTPVKRLRFERREDLEDVTFL